MVKANYTSLTQLPLIALLPVHINMKIAYRGSRYGEGENEGGDYMNCPFTEEQFNAFEEALFRRERISLRELFFRSEIEQGITAGIQFFEGLCLWKSLPGATRPCAHVTNRAERPGVPGIGRMRLFNLPAETFPLNFVGFQTNLTYSEQKLIFRMISGGIGNGDFVWYGRCTATPSLPHPGPLPSLQFRGRGDRFKLPVKLPAWKDGHCHRPSCRINGARLLHGSEPVVSPKTTMLGALCYYITNAAMKDFQPMKANFGILPSLKADQRMDKRERARLYVENVRRGLIWKHFYPRTRTSNGYAKQADIKFYRMGMAVWGIILLTRQPGQFNGKRAYQDVIAQSLLAHVYQICLRT